ncbi:MAG: response regulator transcription factor [Dysgonamonadaceae bacterium]|jgi:DNA-binding NarL/FixJ family response regulator|nr:response regulator transcription factor [Dysgonamonadaceae bacterium]
MTNYLRSIILADNQHITAAGIRFYVQDYNPWVCFSEALNKKDLIDGLLKKPDSLVVLDYALFDFSRPEELIIIQNRFPESHFLLFSEELTDEFLKKIYNDPDTNADAFSIILKDCTKEEILLALHALARSQQFICQRIINHLQARKQPDSDIDKRLTHTEKEVLRLIAQGKSTKEIAGERFLSTHTVNTHRKNIFRKLEVNNLHEATKYALRAGIVDASDYYI